MEALTLAGLEAWSVAAGAAAALAKVDFSELSADHFWPPTRKSRPFLYGVIFVELFVLWFCFGRPQRKSKMAQKEASEQLERLRQGMQQLVDAEGKKDREYAEKKRKALDDSGEGVKALLKKVAALEARLAKVEEAADAAPELERDVRLDGLPEASRIFDLLYDSVTEEPTTVYGIPKNDENLLTCRELLDRAIQAELQKTKEYTAFAQAQKEHILKSAKRRLSNSNSLAKTDDEIADEKWMEEHDTTTREIAGYADGSKLRDKIEFAKTVVKSLGKKALQNETARLLTDCQAVLKLSPTKGGAALRLILGLVLSVLPLWILALCFDFVEQVYCMEFDKYLFSGRVVTGAMNTAGRVDLALARAMAIDMAYMSACRWTGQLLADVFFADVKRRFGLGLKSKFMECMMFQDFEYFEKHGAAALQKRLNYDTEQVCENLLMLPRDIILHCGNMALRLKLAFEVAPPEVVLSALLPIPFVAYFNRRLIEYSHKQNRRGRKMAEKSMKSTNEVLSNIKTVRAFATEKQEVQRFRAAALNQAHVQEVTGVVSKCAFHVFLFVLHANVGLVIYMCGKSVASGSMKLADCGIVAIQVGIVLVHQFQHLFDLVPKILEMLDPLQRVVDNMSSESKIEPNPNIPASADFSIHVKSKQALADLLSKVVDAHAEDSSDKFANFVKARVEIAAVNGVVPEEARCLGVLRDDVEIPVFAKREIEETPVPFTILFSRKLIKSGVTGHIEFQNVEFHYPLDLRKKVLNGLTFKVEPGQKVGLCGEAGCGKSTTFTLLQRYFDAEATGGQIFLDGIELPKYNVHFLRQRVGVVAQQTVLFQMSLYQNITYGMKPTPSEGEVKEALKLAQAWDFVDAKPDKLMTELTATGGGFSGGQMQRLSIARALIRKPDVILLDEATAALDPVNERAVQDTLDRVMKGYTTLVIAHRLTTIKDSDKIIVLDHGKVVEEGTHEQLLKIQVEAEVDNDGKKTIKSGFYHNQWRTQFAEKGLTTKQLKEKVAQLQLQMQDYKAKIARTRRLMKKWQSAGLFAHLFEQVQREDSQEAFEDVPEMPQFDRDTTAMSYLTAGEAVITELLTPSGGQALIEF